MDQPSSTESSAITLRIKFKSASLDEFINRYGADVSPGGIFIRTKQPVDVGTSLQFDFQLADGSPLLAGLGTVAWVRESDPARANNVPGMGLRFDRLTLESQQIHQQILAEKARKEGKASSTPYPPTSPVAPSNKVSPAPDGPRALADSPARPESGISNLAITRPAPAVPVRPAPAPPAVSPFSLSDDANDFDAGGKTEISDKSVEDYIKEAGAGQTGRGSVGKTSEEAVPDALLDDWKTDASSLPTTSSGPEPAGWGDFREHTTAAGEARPAELAKTGSGERPAVGKPGGFASLLDLDGVGEKDDSSAKVSEEALDEISAGAPLDESPAEKTEEVSLAAEKTSLSASPFSDAAPAANSPLAESPFADAPLGDAPLSSDRPSSAALADAPVRKKGGSKGLVIGIAVAAVAAFAGVYLFLTKPWQTQASVPVSPSVVAKPAPALPPPPPPAAAPTEPSKPAVAEEAAKKPAPEEPAANKPAEEEAKPAAAAKAEPEKAKPEKLAEKPAEKPVAEKPKSEKAEKAEKAESAKEAKAEEKESSGKGGTKPSSKSATKWTDDDKPSADGEEVYRLLVRSAPVSAEVLIDGEYFARTPCERRILDPNKSFAITIRKEGYEPHERMLGPSDNWTKKGGDRVLTVTVRLKKLKNIAVPAEPMSDSPAATEAKSEKKPEAAPAAKTEAKPAAEKATTFKPVPNFDESGKAKE